VTFFEGLVPEEYLYYLVPLLVACCLTMALSMNFFDAADRSASTQYEIIALFSSSMFSSIQSSSQQIFDIDGRPFHPVNHHEIVGDVLEPTDPEWDDTLALEPIPVSDYMFSHEGMDGTGMDSSSSHRYTHATDGECSDSSSASSGLFHGVAIGDDADSPSTSFSNNFQTASITGPAAEKQHWQHENLHRQVTDTFTTSSEDDQSLPVVVAGQDNRFKPFHEEKWNQRYKELLVFYAQHGHVAVPHTYPPNQQLARWIKRYVETENSKYSDISRLRHFSHLIAVFSNDPLSLDNDVSTNSSKRGNKQL
jgi:hypothetical protein